MLNTKLEDSHPTAEKLPNAYFIILYARNACCRPLDTSRGSAAKAARHQPGHPLQHGLHRRPEQGRSLRITSASKNFNPLLTYLLTLYFYFLSHALPRPRWPVPGLAVSMRPVAERTSVFLFTAQIPITKIINKNNDPRYFFHSIK